MSLPPSRQLRPAAIHGRVSDADDKHVFADRCDVAEGDGLQPVDADVDAVRIVTARDVELLAARRAGADENRVEAFVEQRLHAVDGRVIANVDAHIEDLVDLVIEHVRGQTERRNVSAHQSAGLAVLFEHHDFVAQRQKVVGDGERCGARADAGDALSVFLRWDLRQQLAECRRARSAATRLRRQMATGFPSRRPRRQAGSHGRSQVRPRMAGKTFDSRLSMYASV